MIGTGLLPVKKSGDGDIAIHIEKKISKRMHRKGNRRYFSPGKMPSPSSRKADPHLP